MKLYQFVFSPFAIKVRVALALKGLAVELVDVTLERYAELLRLNPRAKAPVLVDGETIVPDSTAIFEYIDARVPTPPLVPADPVRRARSWLLEDWSDESFYWFGIYFQVYPEENTHLIHDLYAPQYPVGVRTQVAGQILENLRQQTHQQGIGRKPVAAVETELARHTLMLADLLGSEPYFGGASPDIADCALYGQCRLLARAPQGAVVVAAAPLAAWFRRMHVYDPHGFPHEPYGATA